MAIKEKMKAVKVVDAGKVDVQTVPVPTLDDESVLVAVKAIAINPTDWKHIDYFPDAGSTVGCDFSGEVVKVPEGVEGFKVGDRVAGLGHGCAHLDHEAGVFAEYVKANTGTLLRIHESMSYEGAATLPVAIQTVGQGMYMPHNSLGLAPPTALEPKQTNIFIYGGSTTTGLMAIQYAKLSNYRVITTCSPKNFEYVKSMGADVVLDYKDPNVSELVQKESDYSLKYVFDCISEGDSPKICAESFGPLGGIYTYVLVAADVSCMPENVKAYSNLAYSALGKDYLFFDGLRKGIPEDKKFAIEWTKVANQLLGERKLTPPKIRVMPNGLDGVSDALDYVRTGKVSAEKLVLRIEDTPGI